MDAIHDHSQEKVKLLACLNLSMPNSKINNEWSLMRQNEKQLIISESCTNNRNSINNTLRKSAVAAIH